MTDNDTAVDLFKRRRALGSTSVLIFYRGERSFFCRQWLRRWLSIPALERRLNLMDVVLIFTTSQSQGKALSVAEQIAGPNHPLLDNRLFFFGDPEHLLVNYLKHQNLSSPVITNPDTHRAHGWIFDYGMVQPAIVAVSSDSAVVYEWTARPSILNVAGKLDRPDPWDVWDRIERRLDRIRISNARAARASLSVPPKHAPVNNNNNNTNPTRASNETRPPSTTAISATGHHSSQHYAQHQEEHHHEQNDATPTDHLTSALSPTKRLFSLPANMSSILHGEPCSLQEHQQAPDQAHTFVSADTVRSSSSRRPTSSSRQAVLQTPFVPFDADTDAPNGPLSTSVDTLVVDSSRDATILREDLDVSQTNLIGNIRVQDLSARIKALARDLLAEDALNGNDNDNDNDNNDTSGNENDNDADDVDGDDDDSNQNLLNHTEPHTSSTFDAAPTSMKSNTNTNPFSEVDINPRKLSTVNSSSQLDQSAPMSISLSVPMPVSVSTFHDDFDERGDDDTLVDDDDEHVADRSDDIDDEGDDIIDDGDEVDELDTASQNDQSELSDRIVNSPGMDVEEHEGANNELEPTFADDVYSDSLRPGSSSLPTARRLDLYDRHSSTTEQLEASVASIGSDQVDSTTVISKHPSVTTDGSPSHTHFELAAYSSDRRILEEADDRETGISDYLKELKDPNLIHARHGPTSLHRHSHVASDHQNPHTDNGGVENANSKLPVALDHSESNGSAIGNGDRPVLPESPTLLVDDYLCEKASGIHQHSHQQLLKTTLQVSNAGRNFHQSKEAGPSFETNRERSPLGDKFRSSPTPSLTGVGTSPYREARHFGSVGTSNGVKTKPITTGRSPFADADNDINEPHDSPVILQDEYEAYDEYIVCEYEVEEHVEEYESDGISRSRGFITNFNEPHRQTQQSNPAPSSSLSPPAADSVLATQSTISSQQNQQQHHLHQHYHHHMHRAASATAGRIYNARARGYGRTGTAQADQHERVNGSILAAMASAPTLRPSVDARALEWPHVRAAAAGVAPQRRNVRTVFRKIRVPIMAARKRRAEREKIDEATHNRQTDKDRLTDNDSTGSRVKRKDTLRSVPAPRKRPSAGAWSSGTSPSRRPLGMGGDVSGIGGDSLGVTEDVYKRASRRNSEVGDERCARVGRKDTLRTVLKKIPMPKNRRRASTGEAQQQSQGQAQSQTQSQTQGRAQAPDRGQPQPQEPPQSYPSGRESESQQRPTQRQGSNSRRNCSNSPSKSPTPNVAAQIKPERETGDLASIVNRNNAHSQIPVRRFPSLSSHSYDNHSAASANNQSNVTVSPQERRKASLRLSMDSKRNIDLNMNMNMDVNMEIPRAGAENWVDPDTGRTVDSVRTVDTGRSVDAGKSGGRSRRGSLRSGGLNLISNGKKKDGFRNESPGLSERKNRIDPVEQDQDQDRSISSVVQKSATVSDTHGPESPELRDDSMLHRHVYDGEVWVARLDEGLHNQQQNPNTQTHAIGNKMNSVGVSSSSSSGVGGSMKKANVMSATSSSLSGRRSMKKWRRRGYGRGYDVGSAAVGGSGSRIGDDMSSASTHSVMRVGNGQYRGSVVQRLKARATELAHGGSATVGRTGVAADRHSQQQQQLQQRQYGGGSSVNVDDDDEMDLIRLRNELEPYGTQRSVARDTEVSAAHSEWYARGHGSSATDTGSDRDAERRRWSRWKRRDDGGVNSDNDAMTAEKVGPKMSFASVGERIFSTFKM